MISKNRSLSNSSGWVIFCDDFGWQVASAETRGASQLTTIDYDLTRVEELANAILAELLQLDYRQEPVLLALGSSWCVTASIPVTTAGFSHKRDSLAYLFESHVPFAAEDIVIDCDIGNSVALVVGIEIQVWEPLIEKLENMGVRVESISPIARLGLESYLRSSSGMPERYHFLWNRGHVIEYWLIDQGHPSQWRWLLNDKCSFMPTLLVSMLNESTNVPVIGIGFSEYQRAEIAGLCGGNFSEYSSDRIGDMVQMGMEEAKTVLAGKRSPVIELRQGKLGVSDRFRTLRAYIVALQFAFLFTLTALGASLWNTTRQNNYQIEARENAQRELFRQLFPQRRVPVGIRSQLQNELTRLQGMRGEQGEIPETPESLEILQLALQSLPENLRLRISEIRIEGDRLSLYGQVREHSDAATLVNELTKNSLISAPPFTRRLKEAGFEFRISARRQPAASSKAKVSYD